MKISLVVRTIKMTRTENTDKYGFEKKKIATQNNATATIS